MFKHNPFCTPFSSYDKPIIHSSVSAFQRKPLSVNVSSWYQTRIFNALSTEFDFDYSSYLVDLYVAFGIDFVLESIQDKDVSIALWDELCEIDDQLILEI